MAASARLDTSAPRGWYMCPHSRVRAAERGFTGAEIREAVEHPEITYQQDTHGPGRQVRQHGRVGVVVDPGSRTIITVVHRNPRDWVHGATRAEVSQPRPARVPHQRGAMR